MRANGQTELFSIFVLICVYNSAVIEGIVFSFFLSSFFVVVVERVLG